MTIQAPKTLNAIKTPGQSMLFTAAAREKLRQAEEKQKALAGKVYGDAVLEFVSKNISENDLLVLLDKQNLNTFLEQNKQDLFCFLQEIQDKKEQQKEERKRKKESKAQESEQQLQQESDSETPVTNSEETETQGETEFADNNDTNQEYYDYEDAE